MYLSVRRAGRRGSSGSRRKAARSALGERPDRSTSPATMPCGPSRSACALPLAEWPAVSSAGRRHRSSSRGSQYWSKPSHRLRQVAEEPDREQQAEHGEPPQQCFAARPRRCQQPDVGHGGQQGGEAVVDVDRAEEEAGLAFVVSPHHRTRDAWGTRPRKASQRRSAGSAAARLAPRIVR